MDYRQYVILLLAAGICIALLTLGIGKLQYDEGRLAAPPVTGRLSFDEKLLYFRNNPPRDRIRVLAIGSSMTLNNLASVPVSDAVGGGYLNFSSWGLSVRQIAYLTRFLVERYQPEVVINVTGPMDFYRDAAPAEFFDRLEVTGFLDGGSTFLLYMKYFDPFYVVKNSLGLRAIRNGNSSYNSVMFDSAGGVLLDIAPDAIDEKRLNRRMDMARLDESAYAELANLATFLVARNIRYVIVQSPLRTTAIDNDMAGMRRHWGMLEQLAGKHGFRFINLFDSDVVTDGDFVDSAHLGRQGAERFTGKFLESAGIGKIGAGR